MLLYGPPGCGKSYLAARLASGLSCRPPTIISGPEIMDKYAGRTLSPTRTLTLTLTLTPTRTLTLALTLTLVLTVTRYVGSSEAQLRQIFTSPPQVPPRPGDAADVMMVAEANELHVIVLDEFDAIARRRSGGPSPSPSPSPSPNPTGTPTATRFPNPSPSPPLSRAGGATA